MDHFSKIHVIWAQETKTMEETADGFERHVLSYFGLPYLFHSDNGTEFKNKVMRSLIVDLEDACRVTYGRPRHPQTQGLVEQGNATMSKMLGSMLSQFKNKNWDIT